MSMLTSTTLPAEWMRVKFSVRTVSTLREAGAELRGAALCRAANGAWWDSGRALQRAASVGGNAPGEERWRSSRGIGVS